MLRDLRNGLRLMATSPGITAIAVVALALGIGANTAIFSVVNTVLLQRLPVPHPEQLVTFVHHNERRNFNSDSTPYADVVGWRSQFRAFTHIAGYQQSSAHVSTGDDAERVSLGKVNFNFLAMLGVRPAQGRDFLPAEDRPGAGRVVILSYDLWRRRFAGDPNAVGATLKLDGEPYIVVGILPAGFRFTGQFNDLYAPLALPEARGSGAVTAYGRLKPGTTARQAQPELDVMTAATIARVPPYKGFRLRTTELSEWIVPDVKMSLWVLLGAVGLVLLIACANVANLLVSRAAARRREIAVRAALGAGRLRLIRQLMTESAPLGILGGALGLLLAWWGVQVLPHVDLARVPRLAETHIDLTVLAYTMVVSLLTCLLFSFVPALSLSRPDVHEALKESGRGGAIGVRGTRLRAVLVITEVALALLLSIGATLMIRTFYSLASVNPGFRHEGILSASFDPPRARYRTKEQLLQFYAQILDRIRPIPGVQSACLTNSLPLGGNYFRATLPIAGRQYASEMDMPMVNVRTVDSNYFRTLEIALRKGRFFTEQDRTGVPAVLIINETTARRFFPDVDPIGKRMGGMTIVGVIADVRHTDVSMESGTEVLQAFAQQPWPSMTLAVRLDPRMYPDPARFAPLVRHQVASIDKNQAVYRVASLDQIMADRLSPRRLNMLLLCLFAGVALALAAVGIYGVLSFSVERRTHEIGVRMALGARARDVIRMVVAQALSLVLAGVAIGLGAAAAFTRLLRSLLYGVSATDPLIFAGAAVVLTAVAAIASYLPARRAAQVDPVVALRCE